MFRRGSQETKEFHRFNTKRIIYKDLPSIFFVSSSAPIKEILTNDTILRKALYFEEMVNNLITQRNFNFNEQNKFETWTKNLIKIKKNSNLYKEFNLKIIDNVGCESFAEFILYPSTSKITSPIIQTILNNLIKNETGNNINRNKKILQPINKN